jgi:hypothetical protein
MESPILESNHGFRTASGFSGGGSNPVLYASESQNRPVETRFRVAEFSRVWGEFGGKSGQTRRQATD